MKHPDGNFNPFIKEHFRSCFKEDKAILPPSSFLKNCKIYDQKIWHEYRLSQDIFWHKNETSQFSIFNVILKS